MQFFPPFAQIQCRKGKISFDINCPGRILAVPTEASFETASRQLHEEGRARFLTRSTELDSSAVNFPAVHAFLPARGGEPKLRPRDRREGHGAPPALPEERHPTPAGSRSRLRPAQPAPPPPRARRLRAPPGSETSARPYRPAPHGVARVT